MPAEREGRRVYIRAGTVDQRVYDEIFTEDELDIDLGRPSFIIDAGAHIGLASVYLADRYPDARIVALEPDPGNFAMLVKNARRRPNIVPMRAALWGRASTLRITNPGASSWAFRVEEDPSGTGIPAVGVGDVMAMHGAARVDLLKIDIEGAERDVFADESASDWLERVETLLIELHDHWIAGSSAPLMERLRGFDYEMSERGEKKLVRRLRRRQRGAAARPNG